MADNIPSIFRLPNHGALPKALRHTKEAHGSIEVITSLKLKYWREVKVKDKVIDSELKMSVHWGLTSDNEMHGSNNL